MLTGACTETRCRFPGIARRHRVTLCLAEGEKVVSSGLFLIDSEAIFLAHWSGCALKVLPMRIEG